MNNNAFQRKNFDAKLIALRARLDELLEAE